MANRDREIMIARSASDVALRRPELVEARRAIQEAYGTYRDAVRRASACERHYGGMSDPRGRPMQRIVEADVSAEEARLAYEALDRSYHGPGGIRERALAGVDECLGGQLTDGESAQREAYQTRLLDDPPVGWGSRWSDLADRRARWQARPREERLRDIRPRS